MPRKKADASSASLKKPKARKKADIKTLRPKKRTKSVLVDVIEDDPIVSEPVWSDSSSVTGFTDPKDRSEDIDKQKKYFSDIVSEIKVKGNGSEKKSKDQKRDGSSVKRVGLYRRLVVKFLVLVGLLAAAVIYFSFSKLTVILTLKGEDISDNLLLRVTDSNTDAAAADETDPQKVL